MKSWYAGAHTTGWSRYPDTTQNPASKSRYGSTPNKEAPRRSLLTEHHREALTDEAVRFYQHLNEPTEGLESYSTAAAATLIWDARLLPIRFTGRRTCRGDLVRAHTGAESGVWEPVAEQPTVVDDYALTALVLWQLVCELSY